MNAGRQLRPIWVRPATSLPQTPATSAATIACSESVRERGSGDGYFGRSSLAVLPASVRPQAAVHTSPRIQGRPERAMTDTSPVPFRIQVPGAMPPRKGAPLGAERNRTSGGLVRTTLAILDGRWSSSDD